MPRIPYADLSQKPEAVRAMCASNPLNLTRMMAHATPEAFVGFNRFVSSLYLDSKLPDDLREIGILRAGYAADAIYEITHHEAIARSVGLDDERIRAIKAADGRSPLLSPAQQAVLIFADQFIRDVRVGDPALGAVRRHLSDEHLMDLMLVIGAYMTVGRIMETSGIPLDEAPLAGEALERSLKVASAQNI